LKRNAIVFAILFTAIMTMVLGGRYLSRYHSHHGAAMVGDVRGMQAPDFELTSLDGKRVKLSDFRGKAVVLNFWATWCPPCKVEMPWFVEFQKQHEKDGLVILGIAMDDSEPQKIAQFTSEMGVNYPVLLGTDKVSEQYGNVEFLPTTFYVDRHGKIFGKAAGLIDRSEIQHDIEHMLNGEAGKSTSAQASNAPVSAKSTLNDLPEKEDTPSQ
jgi:peroxiredoxin